MFQSRFCFYCGGQFSTAQGGQPNATDLLSEANICTVVVFRNAAFCKTQVGLLEILSRAMNVSRKKKKELEKMR